MNYYKHHIGDYDSRTAHLTMLEDGAYRRLISLYYRTEKPLPVEADAVCRLVRASSKQEKDAVKAMLREYFGLADDGWHHGRCDEEIAKASAAAEKSREVGKTGGRPKEKITRRVSENNPAGSETITPEVSAAEDSKTLLHNSTTPPLHNSTIQREDAPAPRSPARGTRLSADWEPDEEDRAYLAKHRSDLKLDTTAANFRDYWISKPGKDATKLDWRATWRKWVRDEKAQRQPGAAAPKKSNGYGPAAFVPSDQGSQWPMRLAGWRDKQFWLSSWGPKPSEPGCEVPPELLEDPLHIPPEFRREVRP